ncbi:MAG: AAA family ATPase [Pseudoxanthomonas sp.]|uniref:ExeA family protein n=1 Tax=Pseudoxanthomonas sp. TaxID=1871049 RepID=UPI00258A2AF4|nr:AAA family ATPase [Pseudoxanthomonas sp.]MCH2092697.1 AAA family ATPase [Pseudoxanthomonas sp.]
MGRPTTSGQAVPYRLHHMLVAKKIPQREVCEAITFDEGKRKGEPIAISTLNVLLIHRIWPRTMSAKNIVDCAAAFMHARGFTEEEIADAWKPAGDVPDDGPPLSRAPLANYNFPRWRAGIGMSTTPADDDEPFFNLEPEMLSARAREHFQITRHPFLHDVQSPNDVYLSKDQRYIRETMYQAAKHQGLIAICGESGSGKSTLRRDLLDRLRRDNEPLIVIQPSVVDRTKLTAEHICEAVIAQLSNEAPKTSLDAKARQVTRLLTNSARAGYQHVIMIEEAHDITTAVIKYLKRFWEIEDGFQKVIGVILIGQLELRNKLDLQRNWDAREFINRCEIAVLKSLNGNLEEYLTFKFKRVGLDPAAVFDPDAFDAIRARLTRTRPGTNQAESHLYPLIVQNLIVKCMNQAVELGLPRINAELVGRI